MALRVRWSPRVDEQTGITIPGEYVGVVHGEPLIRLEASRYRWAVWIDGVEAKATLVEDRHLQRAARLAGHWIEPLELAKGRAEAWAADVIRRRDRDADDGLR